MSNELIGPALIVTALVFAMSPAALAGEHEPARDAVEQRAERPWRPPGLSDRHAKAFDRFRALEGDWLAESTAGWAGEYRFEVVAAGSVVVSRSKVDPHGEQIMLTAFHPDGDRLLLTHYCVARNQPRMVAAEASDDGRSIRFAFVDGTSMESRDDGHMDAAEYHFIDSDHFTARWSWYEEGQESWFEEIHYRRAR